jgi:putative transposase
MIEIKKGKVIKLDKEYIIENYSLNTENNTIDVVLRDTNYNQLITIPLSNLQEKLLEQYEKKNKQEDEKLTPFDKIDEELLKEAQKRLEIVKAVMNAKSVKEREEIAKKYDVHLSTIYRWMERYKKSGETIYGLLPRYEKRGGKGKKRIGEKALEIVDKMIKERYLTHQRISVKRLYEEINAELISQKLKPIAYNTLLNYIKEIDRETIYKKREGRNKYLSTINPAKNSFEASYPLEWIQIDHTPLDIQVVSEIDRKPIGRPYITVALDVYSRMVYGIYVSLDPPSYYSVGQAIYMGLINKNHYLETLGIEGNWDIYGLPANIHTDNAAEFDGTNLEKFCMTFGINLVYRPVGKPFYGGHVERFIKTLNKELHNVSGTTFSNTKEKREYNPEKEAVFTLKELEKFIVYWIVNYYHQKPHDGLQGLTPYEKFTEGLSKSSHGIRTLSQDELRIARISLLKSDYRSVSKEGIRFKDLHYYSDILVRYAGDNKKYEIKYDPKDITKIYFYDENLQDFIEIYCKTPIPIGTTLWELEKAKEILRERREKITSYKIYEAIKELRKMEEEAREKTKLMRKQIESNKTKSSSKEISEKLEKSIDKTEEKPQTQIKKPNEIKVFDIEFDF